MDKIGMPPENCWMSMSTTVFKIATRYRGSVDVYLVFAAEWLRDIKIVVNGVILLLW